MTDYIHFSENNLDVYSVKLLNFILRANVECESLLKELYKRTEHYKSLSKDEQNEALENSTYVQVNEVYNLDKKLIFIASEIFYFQDEYSKPFLPFKYKKNGKDSHKIYNSIKHDKVNNIKKADLETAINMLGTLFVLNLCFYPELVLKNDDERSKIFRGRFAFIEPLLLSGIAEIDKLNIDEVEDYFESCCFYNWISQDVIINRREYLVEEMNYLLENHKDEINISLDDLVENIGKNGCIFNSDDYPWIFSYPTFYPSNAKNVLMLHNEVKKIYEALEDKRSTK